MSATLQQSSASLLSHYPPSTWGELSSKYVFARNVPYILLNPILWSLLMLAAQSCNRFVRLEVRNQVSGLGAGPFLPNDNLKPPVQRDFPMRVIGVESCWALVHHQIVLTLTSSSAAAGGETGRRASAGCAASSQSLHYFLIRSRVL